MSDYSPDAVNNSASGMSGDYSQSYYAGGINLGDEGAEVGGLFGMIGRAINNMNGTTAKNIFNAQQAELARQHASAEAQKVRDHELYMSNTAYQRAAADMRAAGINPATLSGMATGGKMASTGSGGSSGSASASASSGSSGSAIGTLLKMAVAIALAS